MWGETLADFYYVQEYPTCPVQLRVTTASRMYAWCRAEGENHASARQLMRLAEMESRPRVVPVYSVERLIRNSESWVRLQEGASWVRPVWLDGNADGKEREAWKVPDLWPPKSVFDPSAYPQRWPLEPFKSQWWHPKERPNNFIHTPVLQQYIPQHLLPEKLVVHDPWNLLRAQSCYDRSTPWVDKDDEVRIYKLKPPATKGLVVRQNKDIAECKLKTNMAKSVSDHFLANPHSNRERPDGMVYPPANAGFEIGPSKPPVYIVFPPKPNTRPAKTAHLYISPAARLGTGNHSFVYRAEYEVRRSFLVDEEICKECVLNDVKRILEEEDGPHGERRDGRWDELSGRYTIKLRGKPPRSAMFGEEEILLTPGTEEVEMVYDGPYRAIQTTVGYQNLERAAYCEHLREENIHPLTTKVQVAAKLSIQNDDHLPKEAANYQRFPKDFFEHYNGFNVIKPLSNPTPVGAIVPQFYGYYVLDKEDEQNKECKDEEYSSPILLVEDCGAPIEPEGLSMDDRCVFLLNSEVRFINPFVSAGPNVRPSSIACTLLSGTTDPPSSGTSFASLVRFPRTQ
ncbi:hypothetical protein GALMADRAFT_246580 [Galerina marginata CBS 339.88]|uniref:Uncharacterized protein n=1 Tax=Galerina marginata (strain CBS 339.88) TaxID=685588 RepID=A0A067T2A2_GALM3|nr:hypothetical protein GALMADRAFT_246580 [Galerina marginata CBS 339.88]